MESNPDPVAALAAAVKGQEARAERTEAALAEAQAEIARLREQLEVMPQQIADAVAQMDGTEDGYASIDAIRDVIVGATGYRCDDDSLWFSGAEWQAALDNHPAVTEVAQLREQLAAFNHCCACGEDFAPADLSGICEYCYEKHIA